VHEVDKLPGRVVELHHRHPVGRMGRAALEVIRLFPLRLICVAVPKPLYYP
jgi:hypothetical protein